MSDRGTLVVVGTGRLARALHLTFQDRIAAVVVPPGRRMPEGERGFGAAPVVDDLDRVTIRPGDTLWLAISDHAVGDVAAALADMRHRWDGIAVVHSSGATPAAVLDPFVRKGAVGMALHPNTSLTGDLPIPAGLVWSLAPDTEETRLHVARLLAGLSPRIITLEDSSRPLYHAAATLASNYSLALFASAVDLYVRAGVDREDAHLVVTQFMQASVDRAAHHDPASVLTGPISRGDKAVVRAHLTAIARLAPEDLDIYLALARATVRLVGSRVDEWEELFRQVSGEAKDRGE